MSFIRLLKIFLIWRLGTLAVVGFSPRFFDLQTLFLGGGVDSYLKNPFVWSLANFDGVHYLSIAKDGYKPLTYFFFPIYPLLIRVVSDVAGIDDIWAGIIISHFALLAALVGLVKLMELDFGANEIFWTVVFLLSFPTSFFLGSVYTESVFLAFSVWSFYFFRKKNFLRSSLLGMIATATRVSGLALVPAFLWNIWEERKVNNKKARLARIAPTLAIPFGLAFYMIYLKFISGDALAFLHNLSIFGEQRSGSFVLFPQVFYRYFFKIVPSLNFDYFPVVFSTFLELLIGLLVLIFGVFGVLIKCGYFLNSLSISRVFIKTPFSYIVYMWGIFIISTLPGSLSSFPRYSLGIFTIFVIVGSWLSNLKPLWRLVIILSMVVNLIIALALFSRGFWIS
jgi:hypothetical protein